MITSPRTSGLEPHLDFIRAQFPALAGGWTFFDNAGGSQVLAGVADRVRDYLLNTNVQLGASYETSQLAAERVAAGVRAAARLVNAADPSELVIGSSTTQLMANLAAAMAPSFAPGDEVIVTNTDHEANVGAWCRLAARGVTVKIWAVNPESFELELDELESLLTGRTRLVCFTHASNVLGTINPVAEITRRAHACGAKVVVDAVAYAPHRAVDVQVLDVDYYVLSLYKVYGPHAAVLYGKREHLLGLANLNHYFFAPEDIPYKLQPGNVNYELTASLAGITDYLEALGERVSGGATGRAAIEAAFGAAAEHEEALAERLLAYLRSRPDVRIIGHPTSSRDERVATVSFVVNGRPSSAVPITLDPHRVAVRYGDFYARRLIEALGLADQDGVVRVSMVHYNTAAEVDRLVALLDEVL